MATETCRHCGALRPAPEAPDIAKIPGNFHVKRGLTIALAGLHPVAIMGPEPWATQLGQWAVNFDPRLHVYVTQPCPCGNYGDRALECACTVAAVRRFRKRHWDNLWAADLVLEAVRPDQYQIMDQRPQAMDDAHLGAFIMAWNARLPVPAKLTDGNAIHLAGLFASQRPELASRVDTAIRVAATIARWDGGQTIKATYLAEALQYQPQVLAERML